MASKDKSNTGKKLSINKDTTLVSEEVGNYEKHPFFIKKTNVAKKLLSKVGLPKEYAPKSDV